MTILLLFSFLAGIFTVLSPCILPILPPLLAAGSTKGRFRPFGIILGLIVSFTFFTLLLTALVYTLGFSANLIRNAAIAFVFLFGLIMFIPFFSGYFAEKTSLFSELGQKLQRPHSNGFGGGFLLGLSLGLLWTPCAGPILASITALVATESLSLQAAILTLTYSIGAAIPLFLITYGSSRLIQTSKFLSSHAEGIRQAFGVVMMMTALLMATHWDMILEKKLTNLLPSVLIEDNPLVREELAKLKQGGFTIVIPDQFSNFGKSPELVGISHWINSPPLTLQKLQGKVVLIDFWTYSCINCLRTLPYLKKWNEDYQKIGLVIIGVHTPEFEFEKDSSNVEQAAKRLGITYPIAQDNDYATWSAFSNSYWPAHYLIDQKGNLRLVHFGEGSYADTENAIRGLLNLPPLRLQEVKKVGHPLSPETYLGSLRGSNYTSEMHPNGSYSYVSPLPENKVGLKGKWKIEEEKITSQGTDSFLDYNFLAKQVYLVLSGKSEEPLQVYLDGNKLKEIKVDADQKYDIVDTTYGRHQLSLHIPQGISAYAFTFGDD
jgi:cytochrome c biogenesis protein CcdA/thiol-disulfide isomerase/thioredoxin